MEGQRSNGRSGTRRTRVIKNKCVVRGAWLPTGHVHPTRRLCSHRTEPRTTHHAFVVPTTHHVPLPQVPPTSSLQNSRVRSATASSEKRRIARARAADASGRR